MSAGQIPAIGSIKSFADTQRALENIRAWLVSNQGVAKISTTKGLVYVDEAGNVSARVPGVDIQEIGSLVVGSSGHAIDATKYYKITIKGTTIKLAVAT